MLLNPRNTVSTRRRQENTRKLIAELGAREMQADDICFFFGYSPSGARKYIRELIDAHVAEISRHIETPGPDLGRAVYRLSPDDARVTAYLAQLDQSKPLNRPPKNASTGRVQCAPDASRHFHVMADDTHYQIKPAAVVCRRDPLVAALFGAAGPRP